MINGTVCKDLCYTDDFKVLGCHVNSQTNTSAIFAKLHNADEVVIKTKKIPPETTDLMHIPWGKYWIVPPLLRFLMGVMLHD